MVPNEKDGRHLLRRKTATGINGIANELMYSTPHGNFATVHGREKEKPEKKAVGGLFRGNETLGSKLVRKLSKMR
jgi:hypothetical protein